MKKTLLVLMSLTLSTIVGCAQQQVSQGEWVDLFDGRTLDGWVQRGGVAKYTVADGTIVGFVMLGLSDHAEPFLWRLLIDRTHQRRGIAGAALALVAKEIKAMGSETFLTSWIEGRGSPGPFYLGLGFEPTGEVIHGETVARRTL